MTVRPSDQLFNSLAELQPFDTVFLADVPREDFSDAQIKMLVRNTQQMGSGLVMLGGPNSFGAGGWTGTELEEAMPVDFQIKNKQVAPIGALAMLMHASEMADGNHWQKKIADAALGARSAHKIIAASFTGMAPTSGSGPPAATALPKLATKTTATK